MRLRPAALALTATLAVSLGGCSDGGSNGSAGDPGDAGSSTPAPSATPSGSTAPGDGASMGTGEYPRYVALGDSYTAAPLVPDTDLQDGCLQSDGNYPHLVAEELEGTALVDVSCSGADTLSLVGVQRTSDGLTRPPQFDAVTEDTSLVTLRIGGNDFGLFSTLVGGCAQVARTDPDGSPCTDVASGEATEVLAKIEDRIASAVAGIQDRAPDARVIVVGYPQIVPQDDTSCAALPLATGDLPFARTVNEGLSDAAEEAARRAGVDFVDAYALSEGHDICSDDPWIAGKDTDAGRALAFHPYAEEQEAVAQEVLEVLEQD